MGPRTTMFPNNPATGKGLVVLGIVPGWGFNLPTAKIGNAFDAMNDDGPRYQNSLMSEEEFEEATDTTVVEGDHHDYEGYLRLKYTTWKSQTNTDAIAELNYTTNWRLIRYADVLLMAAEAYNEDGDQQSALTELNKVHERAGLDEYDAMDQAELREAIKKERQLELAFEGSRYWDLIRWGDAEEELGPFGFVSGKHEHFPIPQTEISSNNEISQEDQNPGF